VSLFNGVSNIFLCGRCGAVEDAYDYLGAPVVLAYAIDVWQGHNIREVAISLARTRGADEPDESDYVEALVRCVRNDPI
jgi:hypothetical protein